MLPQLVIDPDGTVVAANEAATRWVGVCLGELCWEVVGALNCLRKPECVPGCVQALTRAGASAARPVTIRGEAATLICEAVGEYAVVTLERIRPRTPALTQREREVVAALAEGHSARETGEKLGIGESTVRTHVENARRKLGAANSVSLVVQAIRTGEVKV